MSDYIIPTLSTPYKVRVLANSCYGLLRACPMYRRLQNMHRTVKLDNPFCTLHLRVQQPGGGRFRSPGQSATVRQIAMGVQNCNKRVRQSQGHALNYAQNNQNLQSVGLNLKKKKAAVGDRLQRRGQAVEQASRRGSRWADGQGGQSQSQEMSLVLLNAVELSIVSVRKYFFVLRRIVYGVSTQSAIVVVVIVRTQSTPYTFP